MNHIFLNTTPYGEEWMSRTTKLHIIVENVLFFNGFVNIYVIWFAKETYFVLTRSSCILLWIKLQSISIYLVLSWKTELAAMCKVMLSQYNIIGFRCNILKSKSNDHNQDNSQHVSVMALYSASAKERDIVLCLFVR